MDLVERAPGSQSDTVVDTEKMPESRVSMKMFFLHSEKIPESRVSKYKRRKEFERLFYAGIYEKMPPSRV